MKNYGVNELREMFLKFFESKGHLRMNSFSLVPHNDKSLLIINSGMAPLKPYFTGQEIPPRTRVTTCQKCIRTGDLENVGKTARHGTFFEMLGNFSFGDYFKKESIPWAWEFLTEWVGLDPDRLYPSVYEHDDEAFEIWKNDMHIPEDRIYKFGKEDNFWEHGSGPCGPCTEIYYDRGEKWGNGPEDVMGGEGDRFMEVWNVVFSQFNNDGHGNCSSTKISIPVWAWSVWPLQYRMSSPSLTSTLSALCATRSANWRTVSTAKTMRRMSLSVSSPTTSVPQPS